MDVANVDPNDLFDRFEKTVAQLFSHLSQKEMNLPDRLIQPRL